MECYSDLFYKKILYNANSHLKLLSLKSINNSYTGFYSTEKKPVIVNSEEHIKINKQKKLPFVH